MVQIEEGFVNSFIEVKHVKGLVVTQSVRLAPLLVVVGVEIDDEQDVGSTGAPQRQPATSRPRGRSSADGRGARDLPVL